VYDQTLDPTSGIFLLIGLNVFRRLILPRVDSVRRQWQQMEAKANDAEEN